MARVWNVKVDERMYAVQLKGRKVDVNGEKLKLSKSLIRETQIY